MMNQEQYHSAQSEKWSDKPDPATGWSGVTKATPLKEFPPEGTFNSLISRYIFLICKCILISRIIIMIFFSEPNRTDPEEIVAKIKSGDSSLKTANLNNIPISEERFLILCEALRNNEVLEELSMANTMMGDFVAANLAAALESNTKLLKLNIESNNISPQCLVKIFEVMTILYIYIKTPIFKSKSVIILNFRQLTCNKFCKISKPVTKWLHSWATKSKWPSQKP